MTHDPLCPAPRDYWRTCICDLIAKVREDMLAKCIAAVDNAWVSSTDYPCNEFPCKVCGAFELSLTFLRELQKKP